MSRPTTPSVLVSGLVGDATTPIGAEQSRLIVPDGGKAVGLGTEELLRIGGGPGVDLPAHAGAQQTAVSTVTPMTVRLMRYPCRRDRGMIPWRPVNSLLCRSQCLRSAGCRRESDQRRKALYAALAQRQTVKIAASKVPTTMRTCSHAGRWAPRTGVCTAHVRRARRPPRAMRLRQAHS